MVEAHGPHAALASDDPRERFLADLFDLLWERYRCRVEHVAAYERLIADRGATFLNDHIAFRTFAWQRPISGIASISRVFEALGYRLAGCYSFEDKHLSAIHFQHPNGDFPKLFISELKAWELSDPAQLAIGRAMSVHRETPTTALLAELSRLGEGAGRCNELLDAAVELFHDRPWPTPAAADVRALAEESQYAAWVSVHGYNVNHFTSSINSHGVEALDDIEKTAAALRDAGVPMKDEIEGAPGSKLRQTATAAAIVDVPVVEDGKETTMPWTYAYFELAERGTVVDPETGSETRFEGFLGSQATQLFEMTQK